MSGNGGTGAAPPARSVSTWAAGRGADPWDAGDPWGGRQPGWTTPVDDGRHRWNDYTVVVTEEEMAFVDQLAAEYPVGGGAAGRVPRPQPDVPPRAQQRPVEVSPRSAAQQPARSQGERSWSGGWSYGGWSQPHGDWSQRYRSSQPSEGEDIHDAVMVPFNGEWRMGITRKMFSDGLVEVELYGTSVAGKRIHLGCGLCRKCVPEMIGHPVSVHKASTAVSVASPRDDSDETQSVSSDWSRTSSSNYSWSSGRGDWGSRWWSRPYWKGESHSGSSARSEPDREKPYDKGQQWRRAGVPDAPKLSGAKLAADPKEFERYRSEVDVWQRLVKDSLPVGEQALRLWRCVDGKPKEYLMKEKAEQFDCDDGVKKLLDKLTLFDKEKELQVDERIDEFFDELVRMDGESVREFVVRFDQEYGRLEASGERLTDRALCGRLFKKIGLGLTERRNIIRSIGGVYEYEKIKNELTLYSHLYAGSKKDVYKPVAPAPRKTTPGLRRPAGPPRRPHFRRTHAAHECGNECEECEEDDTVEPPPEPYEEEATSGLVASDGEGGEDPADVGDGDVLEQVEQMTHEANAVIAQERKKLELANAAKEAFAKNKSYEDRKRTLEELKRKSTCKSCHQPGHWHNDPVCPNYKKTAHKGGGKSQQRQPVKTHNTNVVSQEGSAAPADSSGFFCVVWKRRGRCPTYQHGVDDRLGAGHWRSHS